MGCSVVHVVYVLTQIHSIVLLLITQLVATTDSRRLVQQPTERRLLLLCFTSYLSDDSQLNSKTGN